MTFDKTRATLRAEIHVQAESEDHDSPRPEALGRGEPRARGHLRSVAMNLTGHKTEAVYRRYAIVAESDLRTASTKLATTL